MSTEIRIPMPAPTNVGGGCGDPWCDYQVQCPACSQASGRQYDDWFARAGYSRSMFHMVIDLMQGQAHTDALAENERRADCTHVPPRQVEVTP